MHKTPHILVAVYDAVPEHEYLTHAGHTDTARNLGSALGRAGLGIIARVGSPAVFSAFGALADTGVAGIALSPATNRTEHEIAYRLPQLPNATIYTGRGAYGTDTMALSSADAMAVVGSESETLENILEHVKDHTIPIVILTNEEPSAIHERVRMIHPNMTSRLIVSNDPEKIVGQLSAEIRRRRLGGK